VVVLERSGHWPFVDDPDTVERAVVAFLRDRFEADPRAGLASAENPPS